MAYEYEKSRKFYDKVKKLCKPDCYNLVLHKHLGDVCYALAAKARFEHVYGRKLFFFVRPQHEFLMKLFNVKDYSIFDIDSLVKKNVELTGSYFDCVAPDKNRLDRLENEFYQAIFSCIPHIGIPFVCENPINNFFEYNRYWCYRWSTNMGLSEDYKFLIPSGALPLPNSALQKINKVAPLSKIVLFAPEAATAPEFSPEFWNIIAEEVHKKGYKIIVNSKKYKIKYGISAFDMGLSLEDVVALGLSCAYVFSLRSGLCDVLVGAKEKLYAFYPAQLRREMWSLSKPFFEHTKVHEVGIFNWKIDDVVWEGINLTAKLQKYINSVYKNFITEKIKCFFTIKHKNGHRFWYRLFNDLFGKSKVFPENNLDNPKPKEKLVKFCGIKLFERRVECKNGGIYQHLSVLNGILCKIKKIEKKISLRILGICVFSKKVESRKKIKLFGITIKNKDVSKKYYDKIANFVGSKYRYIFICRHNIGETAVYLSYLSEWLSKNKKYKPVVLVWRKNYVNLYKMFLSNAEVIYYPMSQNFIMSIFKIERLKYKDKTFICPTYNIVPQMMEQKKQNKKLNFFSFILNSLGSKSSVAHTMPIVSDSCNAFIEHFLQGQNKGKFVIICPESTSIKRLSDDFWNKIIEGLNNKGYTIYVNSVKGKYYKNAVTLNASIEEIFALSLKSNGIITMGSGLSVLLSFARQPMDVVYTELEVGKYKLTAEDVIDLYSLKYLPWEKNVTEYNYDESGLVEKILNRY